MSKKHKKYGGNLDGPDAPVDGKQDTRPRRSRDRAAGVIGRSTEKAGVGNKFHPQNIRVPESVLIKRDKPEETQTLITRSPVVQGNKALMIIDNRNNKPVHVSLIEGVGLTPDIDGRLIFVQGPVTNDLLPVANARAKFAVKADGTVIYGMQGFDDVPGRAALSHEGQGHPEFDMIDIVKLIEYNNSSAGKSAGKKADAQGEKSNKETLAADRKAADVQAKKDKTAADAQAKSDRSRRSTLGLGTSRRR